MPDEKQLPPILSYEPVIPGAETHHAAGLAMLISSCVLLLLSLPSALATVLILLSALVHVLQGNWKFSADGWIVLVLLVFGLLTYGLVKSAV